MKYFALLRDSFREAIDSRVLYFTLSLSGILILVLASVHFKPMTGRDQAESVVDFLNIFYMTQAQLEPEKAKIEVLECEQLNNASEPWNGDYKIVFHLTIPKTSSKEVFFNLLSRSWIQKTFWWMEDKRFEVKESKDGREIKYTLTNHGSKIKDAKGWRHDPSLFFGLIPLSKIPLVGILFQNSLNFSVYWISQFLLNNIGAWVIVLIGVIVTAGFIPNMMEKGTIDLLLSKPISRVWLFISKYFGGLSFVLINSLIALGGVWLVFGLRTGVWAESILATAFIITFFFAILYSVSVLIGVWTRSMLMAILGTIMAWLMLFLIGFIYGFYHPVELEGRQHNQDRKLEQELKKQTGDNVSSATKSSNPWIRGIGNSVDVLHTILPRTDDLGYMTITVLTVDLLTDEERKEYSYMPKEPINWGESIAVSLAFIAVMLGLATWRFTVRDY